MIFNWKKYLAIGFAMAGAVMVLAGFGIEMWSASQTAFSSDVIFSIISFLVMVLVCYYLLSGNINSNYSAYSGMMMFIFLITFNAVEMLLFNMTSIYAYIASGSLLYVLLGIAIFSLMAGSVVTGVFAYIRTRQYITRRYYNYKVVFILSLLFTILTVIFNGITTVMTIVEIGSFNILLMDFDGLANVFLALSVFFTVLRLNPRD